MSTPSPLERILWTQVVRVLADTPAGPQEGDSGSEAASAIRGVLEEPELALEELAVLARWDEARESSRTLFDRLLQVRVDRALGAGLELEARSRGLTELPRLPRVLVVREGGPGGDGAGAEPRPSPERTVVEFLGSSADVVALEPGAKLDQLVDLLVLANQDAAESLQASLGASVSVLRGEELSRIDLLLESPSASIQVFDIERELALLEERLRNAIPAERRPERDSGSWFGSDLTGERLGGKYLIRGLKGKGAFKTVYEGEDEMLGARVAVAVLNPKGARSARALQHFQDEARKLTTLDHENIVRWITFDRTAEGLHYFVMEYLDGEELETVLRNEGRLAPKRVAAILLQCLGALRRAHAQGGPGSLLHLDLKPENVFLLPPLAPGDPERVKVIDFGIGQSVGAEVRAAERPERTIYDLPAAELGRSIGSLALPEDDSEPPEAGSGKTRRRVQRARGGTLLYASPEQCKHLAGHRDIEPLDGRSDLYSLGVMAFRMLTGQFPFAHITSAYEAIQCHLSQPPRRVGSLGIHVPRALAAFVDRCLVKDRTARWRDADEAYEALEQVVHPRLSPLKVAVPAVLVALLGTAALYYTRDPRVNGLTLIDPTVESATERVVAELFLGPRAPSRHLELQTPVAWGAGSRPAPALVDAGSGRPLAGWGVRWAAGEGPAIDVLWQAGAASAVAVLELDGRERWRSGRLLLHALGAWELSLASLPERPLDPRGKTLRLELGGDAQAFTAVESLEVFCSESLGEDRWSAEQRLGAHLTGQPAIDVAALEAGPPLDELYQDQARTVRLRVVARDRAGQEEETSRVLRLAGSGPDFGPATGFVARNEPGSALLKASGEILLLPENALALEATAAARARFHLEPGAGAIPERTLAPGETLLLPLEALGIAGSSDLAGVLRVELDDAPFVDRVTPAVQERRFAYRYTPSAPVIEARLGGLEEPLVEAGDAGMTSFVREPVETVLVVRTPPGSNLWIEVEHRAPGATPGSPREAFQDTPGRLAQVSGRFEGPLRLEAEGLHELRLRKYLLLAGDERGPMIPPEHLYRVDVDRTAPTLELELEGASRGVAGTVGETETVDREPFFLPEDSQHIVVRLRDRELAGATWRLRGPGGASHEGRLDPADEVVLPSLREHQAAEGRYELELVAIDRAGNVGRETCAWQVASRGPALELIEPLVADLAAVPGVAAVGGGGPRWAFGPEKRLGLRMRASDANGVGSVRARLVCQGVPGPELDLRPSGPLWELPEEQRPRLLPWWTGRELSLELRAIDGAGLQSQLIRTGRVPELRREAALVIAPRASAAGAGGCMVEVAAGGEYVFGGRPGEGLRPWNVVIPRAALRPFYLDASEVTRGEYLEFLRDPQGFADGRWWSGEPPPGAERLGRLEASLAGEPGRPATGLCWSEARAYAAWRGKRLPTLLEWEFAVRGTEYRSAPGGSIPGAPTGWPANLCSGAREWTCTPERLSADALDFPSQCRRHWERLLAPLPGGQGASGPSGATEQDASGSHWVVGSTGEGDPSWTSRSLHRDSPGPADVGFRCALDRDAAHALLDRGDYQLVE